MVHYKEIGVIECGSLQGNRCYIGYKGDAGRIKEKKIIVRLDDPLQNRPNLENTLCPVTNLFGNFITSEVNLLFEEGHSRNFILFGVWEERMEGYFRVPIVGKIANFYNPGLMPKVLYYNFEEGKQKGIVPYKLVGKNIEIFTHEDTRKIRSIKSAFRRYAKRLKEQTPDAPCVVIVHRLAVGKVLEEIEGVKGDMKILRMEPQQ